MNKLIEKATQLAFIASKKAEILAAFFVIAIVFMMIMPLPIWLVDILIAVNISLSCLMVVVSLYLPGPLAFSTFPAVLLLTTLFRLGLGIATTRLILLDGDAGHIIEAFGNFVVGGNLVVGLVIFLILTVVQFLVITKGSERVAEVAARFTLDAMPGKQMSIDNDLRSNVINGDEARRRRNDLARESQLFGAMDGAMKFVKGDAIAGLVIVVVNLLGGMTIGMLQRGMTAEKAVKTYSILTIGDGLIAQIPALLISLTAGMIITRVSNNSGKDAIETNVGREMLEQIFSQPRSLLIASGIMVIFALIPGMPWQVFLVLSVLTACGSFFRKQFIQKPQGGNNFTVTQVDKAPETDETGQVIEVIKDAKTFAPIREYVISFSPLWSQPQPAHPDIIQLVNHIRTAKNQLVQDFGFLMPKFNVDFNGEVPDNQYVFQVYETPTITGSLRFGQHLALINKEMLEELNIEFEEVENEPIGTTQYWINRYHIDKIYEMGQRTKSFEEFVTQRLVEIFLRTCKQFFGIEEMQRVAVGMEELMPELSKEVQKNVPMNKLTEVFQRLCAERISVRNVRQIYETMNEWGSKERDPAVLCEYVRMSLRRQICHQFSQNGILTAFLVSPETEEVVRAAIRQNAQGSFLSLEPDVARSFLDQVSQAYTHYLYDIIPPVILVSQDIRRYVRKLIEDEFFTIPVLSFSELSQDLQVQPLGKIELPEEE